MDSTWAMPHMVPQDLDLTITPMAVVTSPVSPHQLHRFQLLSNPISLKS
ncbi:hypothetical protein ACHAWF_007258 [Thalassiosira exigua]